MWRTLRVFIIVFGAIYVVKSMELYSEKRTISNAVEMFLEILKQEKVQYPEVALAQMIHETGFFKSRIWRENHNGFGMKASITRKFHKGERYGHAYYPHKPHQGRCNIECYKPSIRDYATWQAQMIGNRKIDTQGDYLYFLDHLPGGQRYAEDPNYTEKLRSILILIEQCKKFSYSQTLN